MINDMVWTFMIPDDSSLLNCSSSKSESASSTQLLEIFSSDSGSFLFLMIILYFNWFGDGRIISPSSKGLVNRASPNISCQ